MRSPVLISACSKAGYYAVLASLSRRYPPLEGRSPTCYSPVCHSTCGRSRFRVRLACVRHAASVDSEPGSNSHVKFAVLQRIHLRPPSRLRAPARLRRDGLRPTASTRESFWLSCCVVSDCRIICGCTPILADQGTRKSDTRRVVVRLRPPSRLRAPARLRRDLCVLARTI